MSTNLEHRGAIAGTQPRKSSAGGLHDRAVTPGLRVLHPAPAASWLLHPSVLCPHSVESSFPRRLPPPLWASVCCYGQGQTWILFLFLTQPYLWSLLQDDCQGPSLQLWVCICAMRFSTRGQMLQERRC